MWDKTSEQIGRKKDRRENDNMKKKKTIEKRCKDKDGKTIVETRDKRVNVQWTKLRRN